MVVLSDEEESEEVTLEVIFTPYDLSDCELEGCVDIRCGVACGAHGIWRFLFLAITYKNSLY